MRTHLSILGLSLLIYSSSFERAKSISILFTLLRRLHLRTSHFKTCGMASSHCEPARFSASLWAASHQSEAGNFPKARLPPLEIGGKISRFLGQNLTYHTHGCTCSTCQPVPRREACLPISLILSKTREVVEHTATFKFVHPFEPSGPTPTWRMKNAHAMFRLTAPKPQPTIDGCDPKYK